MLALLAHTQLDLLRVSVLLRAATTMSALPAYPTRRDLRFLLVQEVRDLMHYRLQSPRATDAAAVCHGRAMLTCVAPQ